MDRQKVVVGVSLLILLFPWSTWKECVYDETIEWNAHLGHLEVVDLDWHWESRSEFLFILVGKYEVDDNGQEIFKEVNWILTSVLLGIWLWISAQIRQAQQSSTEGGPP